MPLNSTPTAGAGSVLNSDTIIQWESAKGWVLQTAIALSVINFVTLIMVIVSFGALRKMRVRCYQLDLFLACMDFQIRRSVLPEALVQKAIEAYAESLKASAREPSVVRPVKSTKSGDGRPCKVVRKKALPIKLAEGKVVKKQ